MYHGWSREEANRIIRRGFDNRETPYGVGVDLLSMAMKKSDF